MPQNGREGEKMACLKCGKKTKDEQTFCPRCLEVMEGYPVKPDVHIQLPNRSAAASKKPARKKRTLPPEEQLPVLRRRVRRLVLAVVALVILLGAAAFLLVKEYFAEEKPPIGQNYITGEMQD